MIGSTSMENIYFPVTSRNPGYLSDFRYPAPQIDAYCPALYLSSNDKNKIADNGLLYSSYNIRQEELARQLAGLLTSKSQRMLCVLPIRSDMDSQLD